MDIFYGCVGVGGAGWRFFWSGWTFFMDGWGLVEIYFGWLGMIGVSGGGHSF